MKELIILLKNKIEMKIILFVVVVGMGGGMFIKEKKRMMKLVW